MINQIEDDAKQQEFKNRAAYKYGLLSGEVKDKWETVIEQEKVNAQKKKDITNKEEAAKSEELAEETLKSDKEEVVQWYIDALYDRTLYTDIVKKMIDDANTALAKCTDLSNYNTLSSNLRSGKLCRKSTYKRICCFGTGSDNDAIGG